MGPKFGAQNGNKLGSQLGPMSITKLSSNWACQMGPIHCPKFLLSGVVDNSLRFFELAPSKVTRGHRYKLFKKRKGTLGQKFCSARVVYDLWNELDDSTVSVDNVTAFKRKL